MAEFCSHWWKITGKKGASQKDQDHIEDMIYQAMTEEGDLHVIPKRLAQALVKKLGKKLEDTDTCKAIAKRLGANALLFGDYSTEKGKTSVRVGVLDGKSCSMISTTKFSHKGTARRFRLSRRDIGRLKKEISKSSAITIERKSARAIVGGQGVDGKMAASAPAPAEAKVSANAPGIVVVPFDGKGPAKVLQSLVVSRLESIKSISLVPFTTAAKKSKAHGGSLANTSVCRRVSKDLGLAFYVFGDSRWGDDRWQNRVRLINAKTCIPVDTYEWTSEGESQGPDVKKKVWQQVAKTIKAYVSDPKSLEKNIAMWHFTGASPKLVAHLEDSVGAKIRAMDGFNLIEKETVDKQLRNYNDPMSDKKTCVSIARKLGVDAYVFGDIQPRNKPTIRIRFIDGKQCKTLKTIEFPAGKVLKGGLFSIPEKKWNELFKGLSPPKRFSLAPQISFPTVSLTVSPSYFFRTLNYSQDIASQLSGYSASSPLGVNLSLFVRPFRLSKHAILRHLVLEAGGQYAHIQPATVTLDDGATLSYEASFLSYGLDALLSFPIYRYSFFVGTGGDMFDYRVNTRPEQDKKRIPSVSYLSAKFRFGMFVKIIDRIEFLMDFAYRFVLSAGEIGSEIFFPRGSLYGIQFKGGLRCVLAKHLDAIAAVSWRRYVLDARPRPSDTLLVAGAVDDMLQISAGLSLRW